jgi:hypothetical protein
MAFLPRFGRFCPRLCRLLTFRVGSTSVKDEDGDAITDSGLEAFLTDLGLNPEDVDSLILAWQFGAATLGEFSKEEFLNGMKKLRFVRSKSDLEFFHPAHDD